MSVEILPPDEDRKEFFEKSVKPLLIAAEDNNAVDKWMFNLNEDGEVNESSVVFVSARKKMIFVTQNLYKTNQPPKPKPFILDKISEETLSQLPNDVAEQQIKYMKRRHDKMNRMIHGIKEKKDTTVKIQLRNGSYETVLETWSTRILVYDISDSSFKQKVIHIQGTRKVPKIEDFCRDLDIRHLSLIASRSSPSQKVSYQSVCSRWKTSRKC